MSLSLARLSEKRGWSLAGCLLALGWFAASPALAADEPRLDLMAAVRAALQNHPEIAVARQEVAGRRGALQEASGSFDLSLKNQVQYDRTYTPFQITKDDPVISQQTDASTVSIGLEQPFRTGLSAQLSVSSQLNRYEYSSNPEGLGQPEAPLATASVAFELKIPLLKGLGQDAAAADETAASQEVKASQLSLRHTTAQKAFDTTQAYWGYLAAHRSLVRYGQSVERTATMVEETNKQIQLGERPRSDLIETQAALADRMVQKKQAQEDLRSARHQLGLAMGLTGVSIQVLPAPRSGFPPPPSSWDKDVPDKQKLLDEALRRRADYLSAKLKEDSLKVLATAARLGLKPQLDLAMQVGYTGAEDGESYDALATSLGHNVPGANFLVGLNYLWPVQNNRARGVLLQRLAALNKQKQLTRQLESQISSAVTLAIDKVKDNASQVDLARKTVKLYDKAVELSRKKARLGESTVQNVLDMEEKLTNAWIQLLSAQHELANALAELRFQTGTMLKFKGDKVVVTLSGLTGADLDQTK